MRKAALATVAIAALLGPHSAQSQSLGGIASGVTGTVTGTAGGAVSGVGGAIGGVGGAVGGVGGAVRRHRRRRHRRGRRSDRWRRCRRGGWRSRRCRGRCRRRRGRAYVGRGIGGTAGGGIGGGGAAAAGPATTGSIGTGSGLGAGPASGLGGGPSIRLPIACPVRRRAAAARAPARQPVAPASPRTPRYRSGERHARGRGTLPLAPHAAARHAASRRAELPHGDRRVGAALRGQGRRCGFRRSDASGPRRLRRAGRVPHRLQPAGRP